MGSLEKRYAEALLSLAGNAAQADEVDSVLTVLGNMFSNNQELRDFMLNPAITKQIRGETLHNILDMISASQRDDGDPFDADGMAYASGPSDAGNLTNAGSLANAGNPASAGSLANAGNPASDGRPANAGGPADAETPPGGGGAADIDEDRADMILVESESALLLSRFLRLLLEKGRLAFLPNIADEYHAVKSERRNMLRIVARSSEPLDGATLEALRERYRIQYGAAFAEIQNIVVPSLIGGVNIQIGDVRIDDTIYGRLAALARTIAAGAVIRDAGA